MPSRKSVTSQTGEFGILFDRWQYTYIMSRSGKIILTLTVFIIYAHCDHYKIITITRDFTSLQTGDLEDTASRTIHLVVPYDYDHEERASTNYPVVYILHGFGSSMNSMQRIAETVKNSSEILYKLGQIGEMIVVIPHAGTSLCGNPEALECGSFYRNSTVTSNYKNYIINDLINLIDAEYRGIPSPSKRGVTGFSMGGYGAIILTMESNIESAPEHGRFGSVACHSGLLSLTHMLDELANPPEFAQWYVDDYLMPAMEAAFSEGVSLELDYNAETGEISKNTDIWRIWLDNDPLTYLQEHAAHNPFDETAIYFDCGAGDELGLAEHAQVFAEVLNNLGIPYTPANPVYSYDIAEDDYINDFFSGHGWIELRVAESLKFHSRFFYPL